ncbi:MAG: hypothetical protein AAFS04_15570, partial [Cyanobacteria bacterium J06631_9]
SQPIEPCQIKIDLPLLKALTQTKRKIHRYFSGEQANWLRAVNLAEFCLPSQFRNGGYYCTPLNSLAFAYTGIEGQHFSFFVSDNAITVDSPIILSAPDNYGAEPNIIVAKNFRIFMRLVLMYGSFALTELIYEPTIALQAFTEFYQVKSPVSHEDIQLSRSVRNFIARDLNLAPYYYQADEFMALQQQFMSLLELPVDNGLS